MLTALDQRLGAGTSPDYKPNRCWLYLPSFVSGPVVRVVLGDVGVDAGEGQLFVDGLGNRLDDQLGVAERRLRLVLKVRNINS